MGISAFTAIFHWLRPFFKVLLVKISGFYILALWKVNVLFNL